MVWESDESRCIRTLWTAISKIIFAHAEALLEDKKYTDNLKAIVVDEAHLVNTQW